MDLKRHEGLLQIKFSKDYRFAWGMMKTENGAGVSFRFSEVDARVLVPHYRHVSQGGTIPVEGVIVGTVGYRHTDKWLMDLPVIDVTYIHLEDKKFKLFNEQGLRLIYEVKLPN
jgi:hypothetical protein